MNKDISIEDWNRIKEKIKQKLGKLSDESLSKRKDSLTGAHHSDMGMQKNKRHNSS